MAEPICEDEGLLQEWTPQTQLLQKIPLKTQRGLFPHNLSLTCLDVISDYIVIGTNLGFVYWYCRENGELQRLRFENSHLLVTSVKVIALNTYMIAAGTNQGTVTVFQIPKLNAGNPADQFKSTKSQIERFTINDLHSAPVTCIEWSQNEFKFFSGDKNGVVALTEIDLSLHISKSTELLNEQFEIIQLSYSQQILLISTVYRSVICDGSNDWKVRQVGTKERKILGKFGATFCNFQHGLVLYASRPGHRLWLSDKNGTVQQTLIFKSAVQSNCPKIQLINPVNKKEPYDTSFGKVIQFGDNKLITYNSEILYVLHPGAVSVVSILNSARKILDLAVNENEIFILEGERSLIRISPLPDKYTPDLFQATLRRTSFNLDHFAAKIKDTAVESLKKITKDLIITPEQTSPNSPPALADEALELPPIVSLPAGIVPSIFSSEEIEIHSSVQDNEFNSNYVDISQKNSPFSTNNFNQDCHEEVIIRPLRKKHHKKSKQLSDSRESISDSISNPSEDRLVWGVANDLSLSEESGLSQSHSSFSVLRDISSLLDQPKPPEKCLDPRNENLMKTSDNKSQTSLDTCESVSEHLLTSEMFREEQEKTFARLANQPLSLLDSINSEKTDNMSISLNMTMSSSVSSKISENLQSPSYTSENSGAPSRAKSTDSQSTDNDQNEPQTEKYWRSNSNMTMENCYGEDRMTGSTESSTSSRNSQKERLYPRWPGEETEDFSSNKLERKKDLPAAECINHDYIEYGTVGIETLENCLPASTSPETAKGDEPANFLEFPNNLESIHCQQNLPTNGFLKNKEDKHKPEFSVIESLSYDPPSGSSALSSQPASDFSSYPTTSQITQSSIHDSFDHWPQYKTPKHITSFSASKYYVICTDINDKVYYSNLTGLALSWTLLDYKASMVRVSNDGSVVWLLYKKSLLVLIEPAPKIPITSTTKEIGRNVKSFTIDNTNNSGLVVTLSGKLIYYSNALTSDNAKEISCDYIISDVACNNGMILALTCDESVLCKSLNEEKIKMIKTSNPATTSLALGPESLLWLVDETNNIHFSDDFLSDDPHWWQVQISDYIFQNPSRSFPNICNKIKLNELKVNISFKNTLIATNENSVWIYDKFASSVNFNKTGFTGYIWDKASFKILPSIQWQSLCAEGVCGNSGRVWLLSVDENVFCISPDYKKIQSISVPCEEKILCLTSSSNTLWILSEYGRLHSRLGLNKENISGVSWRELKSSQIDNLRLIWVSCGSDVAWACDVHGRTFMTVGLQHHMSSLDPAWLEVEGRPKDVQFEKVFVGSQLYMVWAIDNKRNLYVREGIFPRYQIGTSWVYVCGIEAVHVTISGTSVWALASNGNIYRRCGVSESNFIGDYWKSIPGSLKVISSSFNDELWGISQENRILRLVHNFKDLTGSKINQKNKDFHSSKEDISWEIVE